MLERKTNEYLWIGTQLGAREEKVGKEDGLSGS